MTSLLNRERPSAFCPGCCHDKAVHALDKALQVMALPGNRVAIVSDIGCSGLFDTFFHTHALHGLHGRALTYATGLKMARPDLTVIAVMGDGGLGIGGAHVLSACRRNVDITLLVLNNFNYGMTGGQCSITTPESAQTASGFLNQLEMPMDICKVAEAAGAPYVARAMAHHKDLPDGMEKAMTYNGFAVLDIWGLCPGRYLKRNQLTLQQLEKGMAKQHQPGGIIPRNERPEYAGRYFQLAKDQKTAPAMRSVEVRFDTSFSGRREILLLGAAGQRINTAGELLCLAAITAGLHATQKNDYPITVLRGHSISEVVLSSAPIDYTGLQAPGAVLALSPEGVNRREKVFASLDSAALVIKTKGLGIPATAAKVVEVDFKGRAIQRADWALAGLAVLARMGLIITADMLTAAIECRFDRNPRERALAVAAGMAQAM